MAAGEKLRDRILGQRDAYKAHGALSRMWKIGWALALLLFLLGIAIWYFFLIPRTPEWSVSGAGIINYSARGQVAYSEAPFGTSEGKLLKVGYDSRGAAVYGLLRIPKITDSPGTKKFPGIVLLPGAGVTKEVEQKVAIELERMGYATLTIDQRGIGESVEEVGDMSSNYEIFRQGKEPPIHKMIYDALRGYDLLHERTEIDPDNIIFMGESMGGRTAIIAAGIEAGSRGAVGISTGGYGLWGVVPKNNQTLFQRSIDPDAYVGLLAPRKILMVHSSKDDVVMLENAKRTFSFANEPKRFVEVRCETHGYCMGMKEGLESGLGWMLEK